MLSTLVIVFLPRSKCLLISWLQSPSADILETQKTKSHCFHCFPIYLLWSDGADAMIFVFWMLSFKPTFSHSSFSFIKRLFGSSSLSAIIMVSSVYLRLLIFLPAISIPACASSSPAFRMMCSAYKLNKQGDNIQPWSTAYPILEPVCCFMSSSNHCFLTCIQLSQKAGKVVWYSHLLRNFPQCVVIHTVKRFGVINKAEADVFLELSCFFDDPTDVGNLISGFSAFSTSSLTIWKFTVYILLKPGLENFEH